MTDSEPTIHILDPSVARRIAAGEVIERPHGVVRELLDNSLDAKAQHIEVHLAGGGNDSILVVDDGAGMSPADLALSVKSHATSKIEHDQDLLTVRTLGFRGEALASMAAVSRFSIKSARPGQPAFQLESDAGSQGEPRPVAGAAGTTVQVRDLFYNVPARRQFLKRPQTESTMCRSVLVDKALGFPEVEFRLYQNDDLKLFLPAGSQLDRVAAAYPDRTEPALLHTLTGSGEGFRFSLLAGEPASYRKDRRQLQVFVNRRRIWEYALVQALEYAYRDYLHGGLYPVAYLFLDIEPQLVDFNIHPAKREVRFRNLPSIHRRVVEVLTAHLQRFDRSMARDDLLSHNLDYQNDADRTYPNSRIDSPTGGRNSSTASSPQWERQRGRPAGTSVYDLTRVFDPGMGSEAAESSNQDHEKEYRYLGQIMGVFLVIERYERLFLIDQHAAHERIIYDRLRKGSSGQELLFPVHLDLGPDEAAALLANKEHLSHLGIQVEKTDGAWELVTTPSAVALSAEDLAAMVMDLADRPHDFERELYASLSCRAAVMDGDYLTPATARQIIDGVLDMPNARCPHGRPVWVDFSKEQLFRMVGRS